MLAEFQVRLKRAMKSGLSGCVLAFAFAGFAVAGTFEDAKAAFNRQDYAAARTLLKTLADKGDANAQNELGALAQSGRGAPVDYVSAREWYLKAALQGLAEAESNLGAMMMDADSGMLDYASARDWLLKAAQQGNAPAEFNLGVLENAGKGAPANHVKAREWFSRAAEQGLALAQFNLATMNRDGEGGPVDMPKARGLYLQAANQGLTQAEFNLGVFYAMGEGGPVDYPKAREWFQKAGVPKSVAYVDAKIAGTRGDYRLERALLIPLARDGSAIAQYDLGMMYASGQGGPMNHEAAKEWLQKAANQGYSDASTALAKIRH